LPSVCFASGKRIRPAVSRNLDETRPELSSIMYNVPKRLGTEDYMPFVTVWYEVRDFICFNNRSSVLRHLKSE
jgi:hypothetical protein